MATSPQASENLHEADLEHVALEQRFADNLHGLIG